MVSRFSHSTILIRTDLNLFSSCLKVSCQLPPVKYFKGGDLNLQSASAKVFPDVQKKMYDATFGDRI